MPVPHCFNCKDCKSAIDGVLFTAICKNPARSSIGLEVITSKGSRDFIISGTIGKGSIWKGVKGIIKTSPILCPKRRPGYALEEEPCQKK